MTQSGHYQNATLNAALQNWSTCLTMLRSLSPVCCNLYALFHILFGTQLLRRRFLAALSCAGIATQRFSESTGSPSTTAGLGDYCGPRHPSDGRSTLGKAR